MGAGLTIATIVPTSMMGIVALYLLPSLADPLTAYPTLALIHSAIPYRSRSSYGCFRSINVHCQWRTSCNLKCHL